MTGVELIAAERARQVGIGWTPAHDMAHTGGQLLDAAMVYALYKTGDDMGDFLISLEDIWPWADGDSLTKIAAMPTKERLAKAGALIAAELDRLIGLGQ
jgi:hypothetical protein